MAAVRPAIHLYPLCKFPEPPLRCRSNNRPSVPIQIWRTTVSQHRLQLDKCVIVRCFDGTQNESGVRIDPAPKSVSTLPLGCQRAVLSGQLPPAARSLRSPRTALPRLDMTSRHQSRRPTRSRRSWDSTRGIHACVLTLPEVSFTSR